MVYFGFLTLCLYGLVCSLELWAPITGDPVRESTVNLIEILQALCDMSSLCSSELIHLQETTGPMYNDKKVNFHPIGEDLLSKICAAGVSKIYSGQRPLPGSWRA